jgi:uncharacterized membrane protein YkvA (DUF1232 family)
MTQDSQDYSDNYSQESFWDKLKIWATVAGKSVLEPALTLYYCSLDPDTPIWAKTVIIASLGYFISPLDAIPDITPVIGFSDDILELAAALGIVVMHIKDEHKKKAAETLKQWFGSHHNHKTREVNLQSCDEAIKSAIESCIRKEDESLIRVAAFVNALYVQHKIHRAAQVGGSLRKRFGLSWFPHIKEREDRYALEVDKDLEEYLYQKITSEYPPIRAVL